MNHTIKTTAIGLTTLLLIGGCATQPETEAAFGEAVRETMRNQIYDTNAADYPDPDAVEGADAYRLEKVMEAHRGDVSNPQQTTNTPISIDIGR
ncbi:MAG: hypothetical protein P8172_17445 [Gammaproteobacteria bacterium]|jgi:hypothetical protein